MYLSLVVDLEDDARGGRSPSGEATVDDKFVTLEPSEGNSEA